MSGEEIANSVNELLAEYAKEKDQFDGCAINWGDLGVREVRRVESIYPPPATEPCFEVVVDEVSPDSWQLGQRISEDFFAKHGLRISVTLEW